MILVDTNIFYNIFFETEFSQRARRVIESPLSIVTSFTVVNELIFISIRKLAENRYNIRNYFEFRKFLAEKGYKPFERDVELIFGLVEDRGIIIFSDYQEVSEWREIMEKYRLLPNDAVIAATCKHYEIGKIATFDEDFKRVDFLEVIG